MKRSIAIATVTAITMTFSQGSAQAAMLGMPFGKSGTSESIVQKTGGSYYEDDDRYEYHRRARRRFTKREYDRLPIRITRPGNTVHYTYQDFPHWAARAFQPHRTR